jgi:hypothetical protein
MKKQYIALGLIIIGLVLFLDVFQLSSTSGYSRISSEKSYIAKYIQIGDIVENYYKASQGTKEIKNLNDYSGCKFQTTEFYQYKEKEDSEYKVRICTTPSSTGGKKCYSAGEYYEPIGGTKLICNGEAYYMLVPTNLGNCKEIQSSETFCTSCYKVEQCSNAMFDIYIPTSYIIIGTPEEPKEEPECYTNADCGGMPCISGHCIQLITEPEEQPEVEPEEQPEEQEEEQLVIEPETKKPKLEDTIFVTIVLIGIIYVITKFLRGNKK